MSNFAIGVDLGGTNLRIAAVDEKGQLMEKVTLGTKTVLGRDQVLNDMCEAIRRVSDKYKSSGDDLVGVGTGDPRKRCQCCCLRGKVAGRRPSRGRHGHADAGYGRGRRFGVERENLAWHDR